MENFFVLFEGKLLYSWKLLVIIVEGNNSCCKKPCVSLKRKIDFCEIYMFHIFMFFQEMTWSLNSFIFNGLPCLDINLFIVTSIVLLVHISDAGLIADVLWMGFYYLYICKNKLLKKNNLVVKKLFFVTSSFPFFLIKESNVIHENLWYSFCMQIQTTYLLKLFFSVVIGVWCAGRNLQFFCNISFACLCLGNCA